MQKNKKAKTWIYDQQKQEYFNAEEALAKILNIFRWMIIVQRTSRTIINSVHQCYQYHNYINKHMEKMKLIFY